jgi:hypothetical protein
MQTLLLLATFLAALVVPVELLQAVTGNSCVVFLTFPLSIAGLAIMGRCWWLGQRAGHIKKSKTRATLWWIAALVLTYAMMDQWTVYTLVPDYAFDVSGSISRSRLAWPPPTSGQYLQAVQPLCIIQIVLGTVLAGLFWVVARELWRTLKPMTPFASQRRWRCLAIVCAALLFAASTARFWFALRMFTVDWQKLNLQTIDIPLQVSSAFAAALAAWSAAECILLFRAQSISRRHECSMCGYPAPSIRGEKCPECGALMVPPIHPVV